MGVQRKFIYRGAVCLGCVPSPSGERFLFVKGGNRFDFYWHFVYFGAQEMRRSAAVNKKCAVHISCAVSVESGRRAVVFLLGDSFSVFFSVQVASSAFLVCLIFSYLSFAHDFGVMRAGNFEIPVLNAIQYVPFFLFFIWEFVIRKRNALGYVK